MRERSSCIVEGCERFSRAQGYCTLHHQRVKKTGDPGPASALRRDPRKERTCSIEGCNNPHEARGLCVMHGKRVRKGNPAGPAETLRRQACSVKGCDKKHYAKNLCSLHFDRLVNQGRLHTVNAPAGSGSLNKDGYRILYKPDHPNAMSSGKVKEHVFVMSGVLGRALRKGESVHHKNGIRHDNRPSNLELWIKHQPSGQRVEDRVADAVEILKLYAPHLLV